MQIGQLFASCSLVAAAALLQNGCTKPLNNEAPIIPAEAPGDMWESGEPSLLGLSRSTWERASIAPVSGAVEYRPTYVSEIEIVDTRRENGDYPHVNSVLDEPQQPGEAALEGLAAPVNFIWLLVKAPFEMLRTPPLSTHQSDAAAVQRSPSPDDGASGRYGVRPVE